MQSLFLGRTFIRSLTGLIAALWLGAILAFGGMNVPTSTYEGMVLSPEPDRFVIQSEEGRQHGFLVLDSTQVTRDGKAVEISAVQTGDLATVTARGDSGRTIAMAIDATAPSDASRASARSR